MTNDLEMTLDALVASAPIDRADWSDVVRRARRFQRRRRLVLAAVLALVTVAVATPALGLGSRLLGLFNGTPVPRTQLVPARVLWRLSALEHGRLPSGPPPSKAELRRIGSNHIQVLATRDGKTFYSLGIKRHGVPCFGIGDAANFIGGSKCAQGFPSRRLPILDMTAFRSGGGLPLPRSISGLCCVWELRGFAVNAVANVALVGEDGKFEAVTPVQDNVYIRTSHLPRTPVRAIVALDAKGDRIYCEPLGPNGCR